MGSGKTTWAINYMMEHSEKNFLYITPYNNETKRIQSSLIDRKFITPHRTSETRGKLYNINQLLQNEDNISATHELFKRFTNETKDILLLNNNQYTLIIDEAVEVISPHKISKKDIKFLTKSEGIIYEENNYGDTVCVWNEDEYSGEHEDTMHTALSNGLVCVDKQYYIWRYDPDIFKNNYFEDIYIMTYMFDGSILKYYFDYYDIEYQVKSLKDKLLVDYEPCDTSKYIELLNIYDGNLNYSFPQKSTCMSKSWYENKANRESIYKLRNNMYNYFRNIINCKAHSMIWSTYNEYQDIIGGKRYANDFVSCNVKATNEYGNRDNLAYFVNLYINPGVLHFFDQKNIKVNRDMYSLSYLLQWIWRSNIRNGNPVNIYLPCNRMRSLLYKWLGIDKNITRIFH